MCGRLALIGYGRASIIEVAAWHEVYGKAIEECKRVYMDVPDDRKVTRNLGHQMKKLKTQKVLEASIDDNVHIHLDEFAFYSFMSYQLRKLLSTFGCSGTAVLFILCCVVKQILHTLTFLPQSVGRGLGW